MTKTEQNSNNLQSEKFNLNKDLKIECNLLINFQ